MRNKEINEKEFDELMKSMLLQEKSSLPHEDLAEFVFSQSADIGMPENKKRKLIDSLSADINGSANIFSLFSIILIGVFVIASSLFFYLLRNNADFSDLQRSNTIAVQHLLFNAPAVSRTAIDTPKIFSVEKKSLIADSLRGLYKNSIFYSESDTTFADDKETINVTAAAESKSLLIPQLSDEQKSRFRAIKEMMIRKLIKGDKDFYNHVDADKMNYRDSVIVFNAYSLRNSTVTNLEYKTFLADLLMNGRTDEYLLARVNAAGWNHYGYATLSVVYFNDERFNDFPVVNISLQGAELFCSWLEYEVAAYFAEKKIKAKPLHVRLPVTTEWIYAAWSGNGKVPYANGYNTIYDPAEKFVDDSFEKRMELLKRKSASKDTLYTWLYKNVFSEGENNNLKNMEAAFSRFSYFPSDTIYPVRIKAYSRFYHVSEMVIESESRTPWCSGVNWQSKEQYHQMFNYFKSAGFSPFVGFRYVVLNENDPEYKNPFW
jgi:hypothetical protein